MPVILDPAVFATELSKRLEPSLGTLTADQKQAVKDGLCTALGETVAICLKGGLSVDGHTAIPEPQVDEGP